MRSGRYNLGFNDTEISGSICWDGGTLRPGPKCMRRFRGPDPPPPRKMIFFLNSHGKSIANMPQSPLTNTIILRTPLPLEKFAGSAHENAFLKNDSC